MRTILVAVGCLIFGVAGALAYSHFLGEGSELAALQDQLAKSKADLDKAAQEKVAAKKETDAMSDQIQQLSASKDELKKQVTQLQSEAPATTAATTPAANPMAGMIKAGMKHHLDEQLMLLKARLHLTPDQEAAVRKALEEEGARGEEMAAKLFAGGKIDPQAIKDLKANKTVDQTLDEVLSPEQKTAYQQLKTDQKNSQAETMASYEMNQMTPLLQLNDSQKDQVYNALYQVQQQQSDPNWLKTVGNGATDPSAIMDAQAKAKEDALSKILTPDQLATYHKQAQDQINMQKAMMQKFQGAASATVHTNP